MKRVAMICAIVALAGLACGKSSSDPNTVGGDPDLVNGAVGVLYASPSVTDGSATVIANDAGIATVRIVVPVPTDPTLRKYYDLIPASVKTASGISFNTRMKVMTEGIQDTLNTDGALHTTVKYSAAVGDSYVLTKSTGAKLTRNVTAVSTTDDYPWGGMMIKVIEVEQPAPVPGVKKTVFYANHKFGLVAVKIVNDDNTSITFPLY